MSRLDWFWRRLIVTKLYTQGWGKPDDIKRIFHLRKKLGNRAVCRYLVAPDYPVYIDKEVVEGDYRYLDGHFMSPIKEILPGIMPKEAEVARFQMVLPTEWKTSLRPICVLMGGTGDHGFLLRRRWIAKPLLQEEGIASLILENPFYGSRRPKNQFRSSLNKVSDLFVMGSCLILESLALFNWLDRQGYGPLGTSGISMGGHMASLGATNWHKPLSLIPCMSGSTAAGSFTDGVLSTAIPWELLMKQYRTDDVYKKEIMELIESPEPYWNVHDSMYREGRKYVHELEDSSGTDSENNPVLKEDKIIGCTASPPHVHSGKLNAQNNTGIHSAIDAQSNFNNVTKIQSKTVDQSNINESRRNQSIDVNKVPNQSKMDCDIEQKSTSPSAGFSSWVESWKNSIPVLLSWNKSEPENAVKRQLQLDCKHFMRGVMDECTHLGNFSVPIDPELIIIVSAENDQYIPTKGYIKLSEIWPGSQVRSLPRGHISAFLMCKKEFRKAIADSFELHTAKYYNTDLRRTS